MKQRMTTLRIHLWQDHSPWSVLLTLLPFTTSATTTTATPGLVVATVSPLVSFPIATQESVAGPSCSFSGGSFYTTRQRTLVLAKRARVEPPQKTPEITSKESCGKDSKNKVGGEG